MMVVNLFSLIPNQSNMGLNILVVGTDNVDGTQRSDAISVIHVNNDLTDIRALSIPRDTRANIEGQGPSKLNHAYAYGGISLLKRTVSEFLSIPIDHYVIINAAGLKQIVDEIGGIKINIDSPMVYDDYAGNLHINFAPGNHQLNGEDLVKLFDLEMILKVILGALSASNKLLSGFMINYLSLNQLHCHQKVAQIIFPISKNGYIFFKGKSLFETIFKVKDNANVSFTVPGSVRIIDGVSYWRPNIVYLDSLITKTFVDFKEGSLIADNHIVSDKKFVSKSQLSELSNNLYLINNSQF